jgi:hypothetical protein
MAKKAPKRKGETLIIHLSSKAHKRRVLKTLKDSRVVAAKNVLSLVFDVRGCPLGPLVFGGACQPRQVRALKVIVSGLKALSKGNK